MTTPTIIAIDPGPEESGVVQFAGGKVLWRETLRNEGLRNLLIGQSLSYQLAGIEMVACYGMPVGREVFETCVWIGRFVETLRVPAQMVYRRDVKLWLCNSVKAKDGNIRQALIDKLGPQGTKKEPGPTYGVSGHLWSALAVAEYVATHPVTIQEAPRP